VYKQVLDPVGGSLGLTSIFAVLPLLTLFLLLGGLRMPAQWASLISLGVGIVVALAVYSMPVGQTLDAAAWGAAFGLFPIMWIVVNAIWIYRVTVDTGHFQVLRRSFAAISDDQRIQAIIIAFSFGALIEALAGFGTPVAITSVMLIALGLQPLKAAAVALVANTAPVAFGAIATPVITLGEVTDIPADTLGALVGRQTPVLAVLVPLILVAMVDGGRGIRQTWPAAAVGGLSFGIAQFVASNYISIELTDIIAALVSVSSIVLLLRVWRPAEPLVGERPMPAIAGAEGYDPALERRHGVRPGGDSRADIAAAYAPYLLIVAVFSIAQIASVKEALDSVTSAFAWPGIDIAKTGGDPYDATFKFNWLGAAGTLLLVSGLATLVVLRVGVGRALRAYGATLDQLKWAILTVAAVLALAFVMNTSGQTVTLGLWLAGAGGIFAFLSAFIGWLGVAVTGSDTSSNSLFGALQVAAAKDAGLSPALMAAANSSGGVLGKMISPQNLAIGAAAVGMAGREGDIFRVVLKWSVLLVVLMAVLVYLQSTPVLNWMLP
jgi:lactate permease